MNQGRSRGGSAAPRRGPAPAPAEQPRSTNEQISVDARAQDRMKKLFELVRQRRPEIEAVLPSDVPYLKFEAVLNMAIRREPKLLDCYGPSVIKAAIQSAYDGLLPDGNQAVILYSNNKVPGTGRDGRQAVYRMEARYQSMVYGLRLKLVQAGAVTFVDAKIVHKNDHFDFEEGVNRRLEHRPAPLDVDPGPAIGAYAMAILPDGTKVFDVMRKPEIMAAREVAKTKDVWDGPFELEMWKKTAIRRLSKAIPTTTPIRDAEALEMFPQYAAPHAALPAPPRPHRADFAPQLEHQVEVPLDLGAFEGGYEERETVAAETTGAAAAGKREPKKAAVPKSDSRKPSDGATDNNQPPAESEGSSEGSNEGTPTPKMPRTDDAWDIWADELRTTIRETEKPEALNAEWERQRPLIAAAPKHLAVAVNDAFTERLSDLACDAAGATQRDFDLPAGDDR